MKLRIGMMAFSVALAQAAVAADFAAPKEAEAMVAKAVAAIKANKQKTYEEITAKDPKIEKYLKEHPADRSTDQAEPPLPASPAGGEIVPKWKF